MAGGGAIFLLEHDSDGTNRIINEKINNIWFFPDMVIYLLNAQTKYLYFKIAMALIK
jgi:hypothetical protein